MSSTGVGGACRQSQQFQQAMKDLVQPQLTGVAQLRPFVAAAQAARLFPDSKTLV
jgi:hypothetical protein